jgi:hypothetical protein
MYRYHYFVKQLPIPYPHPKKFQCIRIPEGDRRIPEFTVKYKPIGWTVFIAHQYEPCVQLEAYRLKMHLLQWDAEFEIQSPEEAEKQMR